MYSTSSFSSDSFNYEDGEIEDYSNQKTKNTIIDGISSQTNVQNSIVSTGSGTRAPNVSSRKIVNSNSNSNLGKVPQAKSESHSLAEEYSNSYNGGNNVKITDINIHNGNAANSNNISNNSSNNNNNNNNYNNGVTYPAKNPGTSVTGVSTANGRIAPLMTPMAPRNPPIGNSNINNNNINSSSNNNNVNNNNYNNNNRNLNIGK